jgi:hypothetical protein
MVDQVSRTRTQLHHARELREERAAEFWQRTLIEGRNQSQAGEQIKASEKPPSQKRSPRQSRSS